MGYGLLWLAVGLASGGFATEVDSFTLRGPFLRNARWELNTLMQTYLEKASKKANLKGHCDMKALEKALIHAIGGKFWANIELDVERSTTIDRRWVHRNESIYRDFTILESPGLYVADLASLIRFGKVYIGSDKLGHFVQQGYEYFVLLHHKGKAMEDVFSYGEMTETQHYGLATTGVYSYGDLSANFDGLRFWERITNTSLPQGVQPYFQCEENRWVPNPNAPFDWHDYVNEAWDEGFNCNRYKTQTMEEKVLFRIWQLQAIQGAPMGCPIEPEVCLVMQEHYGEAAIHVVSDKCRLQL